MIFKLKNLCWLIIFCCCSLTTAQTISQFEYFFGTDPGVGNGTAVSAESNSGELTQTLSLSVSGLNSGFHQLTIRAQDDLGTWGLYDRNVFYVIDNTILNSTVAGLAGAEYWFDNDPGVGNGTSLSISGTPTDASPTFVIPLGNLSPGFHRIGFRAQNTNGQWSLYDERVFYVIDNISSNTPISDITNAEYWFDTDPGHGNGNPLSISSSSEINQNFIIPLGSLTPGFHRLGIRVQNANGIWSLFEERVFYIINDASSNTPISDITGAEYWFDTDPGHGNGNPLSVTASNEINQNFIIPLGSLTPGFHRLGIRVQNANGSWSLFDERVFYIIDGQTINYTPSQIIGAEYWFDNDPGTGNGSPLSLTSSLDINQNFVIPLGNLTEGFHRVGIRVQNADGNWSLFNERVFYVLPEQEATPSPITEVEYLFDTELGFGTGSTVSLTPTANPDEYTAEIPTGSLPLGDHNLWISVKNAEGNYSLYRILPFVIGTEFTALDFDGVNDFADASSSSALLLPQNNSSRSVEFSVKTTQTTTGAIVSWGTASVAQQSTFAISNGVPAFIGNQRNVSGSISVNDGNWHDVAITYDGTDRDGLSIYVDGTLDPGPYTFNWNTSDILNTTDQNLILGRNAAPDNTDFFEGTLDDIRVWDKALSATEVSNFAGEIISETTPNLIAYFKFEDAPGNADNSVGGNDISVAQDASGNYDANVSNFSRTGNFSNWIFRDANYWEGIVNTDWSTPNNWSFGLVPVNIDNAVIKDVANQPVIDPSTMATVDNLVLNTNSVVSVEGVLQVSSNIYNDGNLRFKSNSSGTGQLERFTGSISGTGDVTSERYTSANRAFRFITSTVTTSSTIRNNWQEGGTTPAGFGTQITGPGGSTNGFDVSPTNNPSMFTFDNSTGTYTAVPNTNATNLANGVAYALFVRGDRTIDLTSNTSPPNETVLRATGTLTSGTKTTGAELQALSTSPQGFSLVPNPYQAMVNFNTLTFSGGVNPNFMYVFDPSVPDFGAFEVLENPTDASNMFIRPGQSVFVINENTGISTPTIVFNENDKATSGVPTTTVFNEQTLALANVELYNSSNQRLDVLKLRFEENASNAVDSFDALKLLNSGENIGSVLSAAIYAIERRSIPQQNEVIPMYLNNYQNTQYELRLVTENWNDAISVYVQDNYLNTTTPIDVNQAYAFTVDTNIPGSMASDRFSLVFDNTTLGVGDNTFGSNFTLYPNPTKDGVFSIITPGLSGEINLEISNILGQAVQSQTVQVSEGQINVNAQHLSSGVYLIKLSQQNKSYTTKLIIE